MSETFLKLISLIESEDVIVSAHGYEELAEDKLFVAEIINGLATGVVVEDYPDFHKGPVVLVLQNDDRGRPVHVVWGIPRNANRPAVLVTAYRPDVKLWSKDFKRRLK